jgi:MFS family permease
MLLVGLSFGMLNFYSAPLWLVISMGLLSIAEILVLPFMATFVVQRSAENNRGAYMGLYTLSFSVAHILAPYLGASIISGFGFSLLWWFSFGIAAFVALGFFLVTRHEVPKVTEEHGTL